MAKGRKRKAGKRTKSGQLSRAGQPSIIKGNERAQAMQALYGQDGADAIGRAYRAGLLGEGSDAKAMLDTARRMSNAYWAAYGTGRITCTLADKTGGDSSPLSPEIARRREEWLSGCMDTIKRLGWTHKRFFDALVIDVNPDHGPLWLDRLLFAHRCKRVMIEPADAQALELALEGLAEIAGVEIPRIIRLKAA